MYHDVASPRSCLQAIARELSVALGTGFRVTFNHGTQIVGNDEWHTIDLTVYLDGTELDRVIGWYGHDYYDPAKSAADVAEKARAWLATGIALGSQESDEFRVEMFSGGKFIAPVEANKYPHLSDAEDAVVGFRDLGGNWRDATFRVVNGAGIVVAFSEPGGWLGTARAF